MAGASEQGSGMAGSGTRRRGGGGAGAEMAARTLGGGYLFGIPLGDLGWFASLLMGVTSGFMAFFAGTFFGIVGILTYNAVTHGAANLAWSYKRIGLPLGVVVMVVALGYLGMLWAKRHMRPA